VSSRLLNTRESKDVKFGGVDLVVHVHGEQRNNAGEGDSGRWGIEEQEEAQMRSRAKRGRRQGRLIRRYKGSIERTG
jgi:hypothetical protein